MVALDFVVAEQVVAIGSMGGRRVAVRTIPGHVNVVPGPVQTNHVPAVAYFGSDRLAADDTHRNPHRLAQIGIGSSVAGTDRLTARKAIVGSRFGAGLIIAEVLNNPIVEGQRLFVRTHRRGNLLGDNPLDVFMHNGQLGCRIAVRNGQADGERRAALAAFDENGLDGTTLDVTDAIEQRTLQIRHVEDVFCPIELPTPDINPLADLQIDLCLELSERMHDGFACHDAGNRRMWATRSLAGG